MKPYRPPPPPRTSRWGLALKGLAVLIGVASIAITMAVPGRKSLYPLYLAVFGIGSVCFPFLYDRTKVDSRVAEGCVVAVGWIALVMSLILSVFMSIRWCGLSREREFTAPIAGWEREPD